jgi:hypothetical protein
MPHIVYSEEAMNSRANFSGVELDYEYPKDLNLDPKGSVHRKLLTKILRYAQESASQVSTRFDSWNQIDRTLTAYIDLDDKEREVVYNDARKPVSIVFPYTYELVCTYKGEAGLIWDMEKEYLRKYKKYKYIPKINFSGYTECFSNTLPIQKIKKSIINTKTFY